jgi:hypothetical protein
MGIIDVAGFAATQRKNQMFIEGGGLGISEFSARKKNPRVFYVVLVHVSNFCIGGRDFC